MLTRTDTHTHTQIYIYIYSTAKFMEKSREQLLIVFYNVDHLIRPMLCLISQTLSFTKVIDNHFQLTGRMFTILCFGITRPRIPLPHQTQMVIIVYSLVDCQFFKRLNILVLKMI